MSSRAWSDSGVKSREPASPRSTPSLPRKPTGGGSLGSPSTQIARSLSRGGSLIPSTRFQARFATLDRAADAGRPAPVGAALVVAGRLVVDAAADDLDATTGNLDDPLDRHPGALTRPGEAPAAGAGRLDLGGVAQLEAGAQTGTVDLAAGSVEAHLAAAGERVRVRPLPAPLAVPEDPEALSRRPHLRPRRAEHQLRGEDRDVAPALAQLAVVEERKRVRVHPRDGTRGLVRVIHARG